jgi:hypothetical protein
LSKCITAHVCVTRKATLGIVLCMVGCALATAGRAEVPHDPCAFFESREYFTRVDGEVVPLVEVRSDGLVTLVVVVLATTYRDAHGLCGGSACDDNAGLYVHVLESLITSHPLGSHFVVVSDHYHEERHAHRILGLV